MSFIAQEQGTETSSPIELYEINYDAYTWYFTTGDADYTDTFTLRTYTPLVMSRSNIAFSSDSSRNTLELEVVRDAVFLDLFRVAPPSGVVSLTIKRVHRTDLVNQVVVLWKGRILNVAWGPLVATVTCESIRASAARYGLRRLFQYQCPHVLYSAPCGASKALFELSGEVTLISGNQVSVDGAGAFEDDWFAGGYIQWVNSSLGTTERRMITTSETGSGVLTLTSATAGLDALDTVYAYPGCDHTINTCDSKFSNSPNYGGFPYTPTKNPFSGDPIY